MTVDVTALEQVEAERIPEALGALESARAVLWARLTVPRPAEGKEEPREGIDERLLTAQEVAERLHVSVRWAYRHAGPLGAVKLSENKLRFSEAGLRRYLKRRRG